MIEFGLRCISQSYKESPSPLSHRSIGLAAPARLARIPNPGMVTVDAACQWRLAYLRRQAARSSAPSRRARRRPWETRAICILCVLMCVGHPSIRKCTVLRAKGQPAKRSGRLYHPSPLPPSRDRPSPLVPQEHTVGGEMTRCLPIFPFPSLCGGTAPPSQPASEPPVRIERRH